MAGERKYVEFRTICAHSAFGPRFSSEEYTLDGNVACLRTMDIDSNGRINFPAMPIAKLDLTRLTNHILQRDDIVITRTGAYLGKVAVFTEFRLPVLAGAFSIYFRLKRDVADPVFVRYFFNSAEGQLAIRSIATGSAQPNLNIPNLHSLKVPLPPLSEQRAIAAVLGALDDKIELNRRMNVTLEGMARALFQSWFVDFDPVRAKLDGRQPVGVDKATAAFFPEHVAHGEHDKLPVGWHLALFDEVCTINAWTLGKNDDLETLEYVEISDVCRGNIANIVTYTRGEAPSRARRRLRHGDTVLSTVRPDRGSYFLSLYPPENRVASTGFAVLSPTNAPWSFPYAALTMPEVSDHLGQMADGGAYPAVRPEVIGAMQIAIPNETKILEAFHSLCAPLFEQAEANRTQSRTLATLRDTLLPKLLSGELSVADLQKDVSA